MSVGTVTNKQGSTSKQARALVSKDAGIRHSSLHAALALCLSMAPALSANGQDHPSS